MTPGDIDAAYRTLADRAWVTNRERATALAALVEECSDGVLSGERRERARAVAHSLRGSAGTFGHDAAADAAGELQDLLRAGDVALSTVRPLLLQIQASLVEPPRLD